MLKSVCRRNEVSEGREAATLNLRCMEGGESVGRDVLSLREGGAEGRWGRRDWRLCGEERGRGAGMGTGTEKCRLPFFTPTFLYCFNCSGVILSTSKGGGGEELFLGGARVRRGRWRSRESRAAR